MSKNHKTCRCGREYKTPEGYGIHRVHCDPEKIEPGELDPKELSAFINEAKRIVKFHQDKANGLLALVKTVEDFHKDVAST